MAVSDMNVRVGLDLRELRKGTREMEKLFQQTSSNLSSIGNSMMLGITAPILGIGVAAIKAAGDMEELRLSLETTMGNAGYSAGQARIELEKLREVGKNPGIDFEQAVKASLRLQGVGMDANRARVTIESLGKAIAASGGSPETLDRVTLQMGQIISKGKILTSDLNVMKEALPSLSKSMQNAFGTSTAEGLREAGINAEQFIRGITDEMQAMGPVSSGINNGIVNMFNSIKQFAGEIGTDLNNMFGISGAMDEFGNWLGGITTAWEQLSGGTKETIIQVLAFAAALGPAFKLVQFGVGIIEAYKVAMAGLKAAQMTALVTSGALVGVTKELTAAELQAAASTVGFSATWKAMDAAVKATVIGAAVAVVLALGAAFLVTAKEANNAEIAQQGVIDVQQKAAVSADIEMRKVYDLTDALLSHKTTLEQKQASLKELQKISPEYYGKFGDNIKATKEIEAATKAYANELIRLKTVEAAASKIGELKSQIASLGSTTETSMGQSAMAVFHYAASLGGLGTMSLDDFYNEQKTGAIAKSTESLNTQVAALEKLIDENKKLSDILPPVNDKIKDQGDAAETAAEKKKRLAAEAKANKEAMDKEAESMKDLIKMLDEQELALEEIQHRKEHSKKTEAAEIKRLKYTADVAPIEMPDTTGLDVPGIDAATIDPQIEALGKLGEALDVNKAQVDTASESFMSWGVASADTFSALQEGMSAMAAVSGEAFGGLIDSALGVSGAYKSMGAAALVAALKMVKAALAASIAKAIQNSIFTAKNPIIGLALAGIASAGVMALFGKLEQSVSKSPKFAKGAMVYGPTSAIVGDNPGASVDPEVIAPLSKLKEYMGDGTGSANVSGEFRIRGADLVLAIEKNNQINNRIKGR